jgi:hypothetical protein
VSSSIRQRSEVDYTLATIGGGGENAGRNRATVFVRLKPVKSRRASQDDLIEAARAKLKRFDNSGVRSSVGPASDFGGGGDVQFAVTGPDLQVLERLSSRLLNRLRATPGVADADSSLVAGKPELSARVDRDMAAVLGVQPSDVASALNFLVGENEVSRFEEAGEQYEVHVRAASQFRSNEAGLSLLTVPASPPEASAADAPASTLGAAGRGFNRRTVADREVRAAHRPGQHSSPQPPARGDCLGLPRARRRRRESTCRPRKRVRERAPRPETLAPNTAPCRWAIRASRPRRSPRSWQLSACRWSSCI